MKKRILIVAILAVMVGGFLGAQEAQTSSDSELFVHTVYLNQVFRHRLGFKVTYTAENLDFQEKYLPSSWFNSAAGKGDLVETDSKSAPYMDVYFRDGEFSHVRLFVRDNPDHGSWGRLENEANTQEKFDVETLEL